ncbi:phage prohead protease HK97 family protein [Amycolatopsis methanolica 239]|uniref:Phage prohead protease HK97 family protein n=1 Tax=Amycolatopsis methanolica 239 TaxID=1068978 RepID=A0A076N538_AMYME|nr:phage prohead protease HK97 family protein [Amycolatopsis methanolica 239]AIJ26426.1 phage prohead protease HK97 family protein [Amycolatopsis methanolica 239]
MPLATAGVSIRADADVEGGERFRGYAAVFNSRTAIGNPLRWGFYEEIAPGAFTKTLAEGDARFLIDHDSYYVVSRVSAGTLNLSQDDKGLPVDSALDTELSYVRDLKANVRNKNITGMSFGFYVVKDEWATEEVDVDGYDEPFEVDVRRILEVRLIEVSAVTFPAYEETQAELNSVAAALAHRGDPVAIERRAAYKPELLDLLKVVEREPGETTRADGTEPGETTRLSPSDLLTAYAARYGLPLRKDN